MHESETGVRFKSAAKGKATVYHTGVAAGNGAEVAFDVGSMALRFQMSEGEFKTFAADLQTATRRPVEPNTQFNWPRVGLASEAHVALVREAIRERLQRA